MKDKNQVLTSVKNCLIIGYGSIGARHAQILKTLGYRVNVVTDRECKDFEVYEDITSVLKTSLINKCCVDYAVICNKTADHYKAVRELEDNHFNGTLLIEKPLFAKSYSETQPVFDTYVAYNLRFHPVLQNIYNLVQNSEIYSMHVYCGQYLPCWRNGDYRKSYSASRKEGGGVLRDLSHELDYINWITGGWKRVTATGGKVSSLEIDSDDLFCILMETEKCPAVSLQINYLDLEPRREIILNGDGFSLKADLIKETLAIGNEKKTFDLEKNYTYLCQHQAVLNIDKKYLCDFAQGVEVLKLIEAIEESDKRKVWIEKKIS